MRLQLIANGVNQSSQVNLYFRSSTHLLKSNALNLDRHTLGQLGNSNTATSWLVGEELLVCSVHLSEVGHVSEEDLCFLSASIVLNVRQTERKAYVDLDNLGHAGTSSVKDSLDVVTAGLGQDANVALDKVGRGIGGDLAGDEDLAVGTDSLRLFID